MMWTATSQPTTNQSSSEGYIRRAHSRDRQSSTLPDEGHSSSGSTLPRFYRKCCLSTLCLCWDYSFLQKSSVCCCRPDSTIGIHFIKFTMGICGGFWRCISDHCSNLPFIYNWGIFVDFAIFLSRYQFYFILIYTPLSFISTLLIILQLPVSRPSDQLLSYINLKKKIHYIKYI